MHTPARTYTGSFPIGFRQLRPDWKMDFDALAEWAATNRFGFIDVIKAKAIESLKAMSAAGLQPGSVDLLDWNGYLAMITPDSDLRRETIKAVSDHVEECAAFGARIFFAVTIPADRALPRPENFNYLVESYGALTPVLERTGSKVVLEGWPGPGAVVCTPETYRAFFQAVRSDAFRVNYDPSHLLRMGIDPIRFLKEFGSRVFHVHAKDTAFLADELYEYGHEQPPTFAPGHKWGGAAWRYALPGHGVTPWINVFRALAEAGYKGLVSVELEDENFNGTPEGEQRGLLASRDFLEGC